MLSRILGALLFSLVLYQLNSSVSAAKPKTIGEALELLESTINNLESNKSKIYKESGDSSLVEDIVEELLYDMKEFQQNRKGAKGKMTIPEQKKVNEEIGVTLNRLQEFRDFIDEGIRKELFEYVFDYSDVVSFFK